MCIDANSSDSGIDKFKVFDTFRRRISDEDRLINDRTTWLILIETSFIAAWGALSAMNFEKSVLKDDRVVTLILILLSIGMILLSYAAFCALNAAFVEIDEAKKQYEHEHKNIYHDPKVPNLMGRSYGHQSGHSISRITPWFYGVIGLVLLILSILIAFQK